MPYFGFTSHLLLHGAVMIPSHWKHKHPLMAVLLCIFFASNYKLFVNSITQFKRCWRDPWMLFPMQLLVNYHIKVTWKCFQTWQYIRPLIKKLIFHMFNIYIYIYISILIGNHWLDYRCYNILHWAQIYISTTPVVAVISWTTGFIVSIPAHILRPAHIPCTLSRITRNIPSNNLLDIALMTWGGLWSFKNNSYRNV